MPSGQEYFYIIAYDIASDRRRRRVADLLELHATRVQGSVFETILTMREAETLRVRITDMLAPPDLLRIYPVRLDAIGKIGQYGGAPPQAGADYWVI